MKPIRKNRFKREKIVRRARLRERIALTVRAMAGAVVLAAVSAGFVLVHDYFTQSPLFQARDVEVAGVQRLSREQVLAIAGVSTQTNILLLNLTTTRIRLMADPWIADATVSREIPSKLRIAIREEEPLAVLEMGAGDRFLINAAGRVFSRDAGGEADVVPRVQGLGHADLPIPGQPDSEAFTAVMTLLTLAREQNSPLPFAALKRIFMDREIGATAYAGEDNRAIKLGFGHYREKCAALKDLMARVRRDSRFDRCQVIDLYDVNRIVITLAPAGSSGSDPEEV